MNVKRYLAVASILAVAVVAAPAANASTTGTAQITVKWNTQAINTISAVTDYTVAAGVASQGTAALASYLTNANVGSGSCGTPATETAGQVNFYNVTPDNGTANKYTDCYYKNAVDVHVFTTDASGYGLAVAGTLPFSKNATTDTAAGPYILCEIAATGGWANNVGAANAATTAMSLGSAPALDNGGTNTCAHAGTAVGTSGIVAATTGGTGGTVLASQANATGSAGADFGGDIELGIPPLAGAYAGVQSASVVLTYTATFN